MLRFVFQGKLGNKYQKAGIYFDIFFKLLKLIKTIIFLSLNFFSRASVWRKWRHDNCDAGLWILKVYQIYYQTSVSGIQW